MIFPFEFLSEAGRELGLVVAVVIGLAFGFVLERAGFGRADKLAAQFYFRDMTVLKVMFSAIVTAMLGLVAASYFGLADLRAISESIASWTYIWPMLVGGLVLGAGFIISGYCPGTSIVAASSGNMDGLMTVVGVVTGTWVYTQLLRIPAVTQFHNSGEKEAWFLYDILPLAPWAIAALVALVAVVAFWSAEKVELAPARGALRIAAPAFAALAIVIGTAALLPMEAKASSAKTAMHSIPAADIVREPWRYRVENKVATDLATNEAYAIRGEIQSVAVSSSATPRPAGTFVKPKKKGGGCSS